MIGRPEATNNEMLEQGLQVFLSPHVVLLHRRLAGLLQFFFLSMLYFLVY